jgi:RNA-directed DNA polymerase
MDLSVHGSSAREGLTTFIYAARSKLLAPSFPSSYIRIPLKALPLIFFNYTEASVIFQDLSGGTGELKKLLADYRLRLSSFKQTAMQPVIMIVDNDKGSTGLFHQLTHIIGKPVGGVDPFYHVFDNLYVVPVPKAVAEAAIEDLFDPALLKRTIKGRSFDRTGKAKDFTKWYSKVDFATQIVKPERSIINFSGFEPLLKTISDVRKDFSLRLSVTTPVATAATRSMGRRIKS